MWYTSPSCQFRSSQTYDKALLGIWVVPINHFPFLFLQHTFSLYHHQNGFYHSIERGYHPSLHSSELCHWIQSRLAKSEGKARRQQSRLCVRVTFYLWSMGPATVLTCIRVSILVLHATRLQLALALLTSTIKHSWTFPNDLWPDQHTSTHKQLFSIKQRKSCLDAAQKRIWNSWLWSSARLVDSRSTGRESVPKQATVKWTSRE